MPTLSRVFPFVRLLDLANILTMFNIGLAFGTVYFVAAKTVRSGGNGDLPGRDARFP